ncbi:MAG: prolyl-tRNA synthetase [Syntrophobacter sp. DG_60]|nr:MAG: prolyl-tRNA synthetase [Syntrophobacter sp. DG_60]
MRFSKFFIPTLKEAPAEAEIISHKLMLRAGMIRKLASGIYSYLPLGLMASRKVENIIREEMNRVGAQELLLPMVQPAELWQMSGRWHQYGRELLRLKDRHDRDHCLGPTHEEVITNLVRYEVRSYRDLPLNFYQIETKFRDEIRPRFGLMRCREFVMKDGYSFDVDDEAAERTYELMYEAYERIFNRCGLTFKVVEAETGAIGGSFSHEFMALSEIGEDTIVYCKHCSYAANIERAEGKDVKFPEEKQRPIEEIYTPGYKTVEEITLYLNVKPERIVKTILYLSDGKPLAVLVRGDHEINEAKLSRLLGCESLTMIPPTFVEEITGADVGFAGPVGLNIKVVADKTIKDITNFISGANKTDYHLMNINLGRDFEADLFGDIRFVTEGDVCPKCGGQLVFKRGIEVGHVFKLGTKYSQALKATYLDEKGKEQYMIMGCYGIGVGRTLAAIIEQNHDEHGIIFLFSVAPFCIYLLPIDLKKSKIASAAERVYQTLKNRGLEVFYDDRDVSPGVKFKDADLIGLPIRITLGKYLKENKVEVRLRRSGETRIVPLNELELELEVLSQNAKKKT